MLIDIKEMLDFFLSIFRNTLVSQSEIVLTYRSAFAAAKMNGQFFWIVFDDIADSEALRTISILS